MIRGVSRSGQEDMIRSIRTQITRPVRITRPDRQARPIHPVRPNRQMGRELRKGILEIISIIHKNRAILRIRDRRPATPTIMMGREAQAVLEAREAPEIRVAREAQAILEAREAPETLETREAPVIREGQEGQGVREAPETREVQGKQEGFWDHKKVFFTVL